MNKVTNKKYLLFMRYSFFFLTSICFCALFFASSLANLNILYDFIHFFLPTFELFHLVSGFIIMPMCVCMLNKFCRYNHKERNSFRICALFMRWKKMLGFSFCRFLFLGKWRNIHGITLKCEKIQNLNETYHTKDHT